MSGSLPILRVAVSNRPGQVSLGNIDAPNKIDPCSCVTTPWGPTSAVCSMVNFCFVASVVRLPPESCSIDQLRSLNSWLDGVVFIAWKCADGHGSGMSPLPLPLPLSSQRPSLVHV